MAWFSLAHILLSYAPVTPFTYLLIMPFYFPLAAAFALVLPHHLLAGVLDYDRLQTGQERQSLYVMFDHSIIQAVDVLVGSLPALALGHAGYVSNGGCACGCGVSCSLPYLRWQCPGDNGYACSSALTDKNLLLFGVPTRAPPCLVQPQSVIATIRLLYFYVPVACSSLAAMVLHTYCMSDMNLEVVKHSLQLRQQGQDSYDPFRNEIIQARPDRVSIVVSLYGSDERAFLVAGHSKHIEVALKDLMRKLIWDVKIQTIAIFVSIIVLPLIWKKHRRINLIFIATVIVSIMMVTWSALKLAHLPNVRRECFGQVIRLKYAGHDNANNQITGLTRKTRSALQSWLTRTKHKPEHSRKVQTQRRCRMSV